MGAVTEPVVRFGEICPERTGQYIYIYINFGKFWQMEILFMMRRRGGSILTSIARLWVRKVALGSWVGLYS